MISNFEAMLFQVVRNTPRSELFHYNRPCSVRSDSSAITNLNHDEMMLVIAVSNSGYLSLICHSGTVMVFIPEPIAEISQRSNANFKGPTPITVSCLHSGGEIA